MGIGGLLGAAFPSVSPSVGAAGATAAGLGSTLSGILGAISPWAAAAGGALQLGQGIAGLFTGPAGEEGAKDAEEEIREIRARWLNGEIDSATAVAAIQAQIASMGPQEDQNLAAGALSWAGKVLAEIQAADTKDLNAAWGVGQTRKDPSQWYSGINSRDKPRDTRFKLGETGSALGADPMQALQGDSQFQRQRGNVLMRNMLMGTESGKAFGKDTGLDKLIAPREDAAASYNRMLPKTSTWDKIAGPDGGALGTQIQDSLAKFGGK